MTIIPKGATNNFKIHLAIVTIINTIFIYRLITIAWIGNDKSIILVIFGYPFFILLNAILWGTFSYFKRIESNIYKLMTISLAILFIPTLIISSLY